jgi:predicted TIM-barrel fold metal-dependent hydrolase
MSTTPAPDEPIIDAHHHVWRLADIPWLHGPPVPRIFGEYGALRRDYPVAEFAAVARPLGVVGSVYIQINVAPGAEVAEVAWVQAEADRHGLPGAIVGFADLSAPGVASVLDQETAFPALRGIRQQLHWHETPLYRFAPRPDVMREPAFRAGMAELARRGLTFDLQVFPGQMRDAADLAAEFPGVTFILQHAGMLVDRSEAGWAEWRTGMRLLAARPNVMAKLSGLGTFLRQCSVPLWRPVIQETLAMFGPSRCLFGSNYPIEMLWTEYPRVVEVTRECLHDLGPAERRAVLHDTARRIYRL